MKPTCLIPAAIIGSFCGLSLLGSAIPAQAATLVDVELGLVFDGSGSITPNDFSQVLVAHGTLFTNPTFYEAFVKSLNYDGDGVGKIAVSAFQFGSKVKQEIGWTLIDSQAAATAFGQQLLGISKTIWGGTSQLGDAILAASFGGNYNIPGMVDPVPTSYVNTGILQNQFNGTYQILDVATDGLYIGGELPGWAAYQAAMAGVDAINSIAIGTYDPWGVDVILPSLSQWQGWAVEDGSLAKGNPNNVAPFVSVTGGINQYSQFLRKKISLETLGKPPIDPPPPKPQGDPMPPPPDPQDDPTSVPEPSTLWGLFGLGAIAAVRRFLMGASL